MKIFFVTIISLFFCFGCNKEDRYTKLTCYKGKYVGNGCLPVIQILSPADEMFKESIWQTSTTKYDYAVAIGSLPDKYKDGRLFYFTIDKIDSNFVYLTFCNTPKYIVDIEKFSDSACSISAD